VRGFFDTEAKTAYLRDYQERMRPVLAAERASWSHPDMDILAELQRRVEPIMAQADHMCAGIGGPVQFDFTGPAAAIGGAPGSGLAPSSDPVGGDGSGGGDIVESVTFDFAERTVRRPLDTDKTRYRFRTERVFMEHLLFIEEVDWVNSLFLSARFNAKRVGQYIEYVYTFFK